MRDLVVDIGPSKILLFFIILISFAAQLVIFFLSIPLIIQILLTILNVFMAVKNIRMHALRNHPKAIIRASYFQNKGWQLETLGGRVVEVHSQGESYVTNLLVILNFKDAKIAKSIPLVLLSDSVQADLFRQIRRYLRSL